MKLKVNSFGKSDIGNERENNEDSFIIISNENFNVLSVCDGMGGHNAGEVASNLAIDCLKNFAYQKGDFAITWREENKNSPCYFFSDEKLIEFVKKMNTKIYEKSLKDESLSGMGTTINAVFIIDDVAKIINVGDSRTYLIRENEILKITKDHSLIEEVKDKGDINEDDIQKIIPKNIITKAIGIKKDVEPDIYTLNLLIKDRIILVTDGVYDFVSDREILNICRKGKVNSVTEKLINRAKEKGGTDNITVITSIIIR